MRPHSFLSPLVALRCIWFALAACVLAGCGGSTPSDASLVLPPDATFNATVRATGYTITDLGPGSAVALNSRGQVLGTTTYTYLWTNGTRHYLGVLGEDKGGNTAISLNDNGQALGYSYAQPRTPEGGVLGLHPFVWKDGIFTPVAVDPVAVDIESYPYRAIKINNAGEVLLERNDALSPGYSVWKDGQNTPIVAVGKNGNPLTLVTLNNNGSFLGGASDSGEMFQETQVPSRTYLVKNGQVTDVGFLPERLNMVPILFNDQDQIVGMGFPYDRIASGLEPQYYLWQNGTMTTLSDLAENVILEGFSNTGHIVGFIHDNSTGDRSACQYDLNTRTLVDLNATVGSGAGWKLDSATAINDRGQIIGDGQHNGKSRSYLLTPLP